MPFTRQSKIRDVWRHPVGHDVLQTLLDRMGRTEKWLDNPLVANLPVSALDRIAGKGFSDVLLEMTAFEPEPTTKRAEEQHAWWKEAVQYQIFLPSFMDSDHDGIGDLGGVIQRLPYLEQLGVGAIWLWPLLEHSPEGAVTDFKAVSREFGDLDVLAQLIELAHNRGIRVMMGIDITATSDQHPWFQQALAGGGTRDYYTFRKGSPERPPNNWSWADKARSWRWVDAMDAWGLCLCGRAKMDLNWDNPAVRAEIEGVLRFWLELGMDGFCFGSVNTISKSGFEDGSAFGDGLVGMCGFEKFGLGPRLHRYLREIRAKSLSEPELFICGEVKGVGPEMAKLFTGHTRKELDATVDESHLAPRPKGKNGEMRLDLADLRDYYVKWMEQYGQDNWMPIFFETARTPRLVGRVGANPLYRGILAKALGMLLLTLRGTPVIYQGEELGLSNTRFTSVEELRDLASIRLFSELSERVPEQAALQQVLAGACDHARTPIPWNAGPRAGFTGAEPWIRMPDGADFLNAAVQMEDPSSVWRHYQKLIALRKKYPCLTYGSINIVFKRNKKVFCYFRIHGNEKWYVEANLTEREIPRPGRILRSQKLMLSNYETPARALRPYEANLYICE